MAAVAALEPTRGTIDLVLRGRSRDVRGRLFQGVLLLALLASLGVLLLLLWTTWNAAQPVFAERGLGFVSSDTSSLSSRAGVHQGLVGSLILVAFVQTLRGLTGPDSFGRSFISGGLTLAVLVMPIVILISMEALRAVPTGIREAAYGVGATRWEVIRSHVLPYASPGMFTGMILSLARAFGETAPLLLVGAVTGYLNTPGGRNPLEVLQW